MIDLQILEVLSDGSGNLAEAAHTSQVEAYCKVALACVLLYHALTTMDCEVKYFWKSSLRFSLSHFVYFLNRYVGLFSIFISIQLHLFNVSVSRCAVVTWLHNVADWATVLLIDYILLLAVLALYSFPRCLSIGLHLFVLWEASMRLAVMIVATKAELAHQKLLSPITACIEQNKCTRRMEETLYWVAPLLYQSVLLILALKKAITYWKEMGLGSHLVTVLVQGHIVYFLMALSCSLMNILECYLAEHLIWKGTATTLGSPSLLCLLGSYMMFNIKMAAEKALDEGSRSFSTVKFAHGATAKGVRSVQMSPRATTDTEMTRAELRTFERDRKQGPNSQFSSSRNEDTEDLLTPTYWDGRRTDRATNLPIPSTTIPDGQPTQSTIALPEHIASARTYYPRGRVTHPANERFSRNPFV